MDIVSVIMYCMGLIVFSGVIIFLVITTLTTSFLSIPFLILILGSLYITEELLKNVEY